MEHLPRNKSVKVFWKFDRDGLQNVIVQHVHICMWGTFLCKELKQVLHLRYIRVSTHAKPVTLSDAVPNNYGWEGSRYFTHQKYTAKQQLSPGETVKSHSCDYVRA